MAIKKKSVKRAQTKAGAASARATAKRPNVKRRKQPLEPSPADRPDQRHRELIQDRRFGSEGENLAELRLAARETAAAVAQREMIARPLSLGAGKWVQLGPTVIPNGQTPSAASGGSRVNVTGRITGIVVNPTSPSTIYVAAARGGVWKTVDGGVTWSPKSDKEVSLAIGALAMAPSDPNRL